MFIKKTTKSDINKEAFTLAEVLITLGIIGIVAAMTLPAIMQNYQKMVFKNQFKKSYANFFNAVKLTQAKLGGPTDCYYWSTGPACKLICTERDPIYNSCTKSTCEDGSLPQNNTSAIMTGCTIFKEELFNKTLKATKSCLNNSLSNGCITPSHRGIDIIKTEQNPDAQFPPDPNAGFSDIPMKNRLSSWILTDGTIIMPNGSSTIYLIDVNGHKGPNKWGYDIFTFQLLGDNVNGVTQMNPITYATEKGGFTGEQMMKDMNK